MPRRRYRPVPSRLKRMRRGAPYRGYLRVYGLVTTMEGKRKRISFQVLISRRMMRYRRNLMNMIRATVNAIKDKEVPVHRQGDVFYDFGELFRETEWVEVRRLHWYKAGVHYER